jgi:hypothetical protein
MSADLFRPVFDAIKASTVALVEASEATARAGRALGEASDAHARAGRALGTAADTALTAREEHEDLRETVARLEALVRELLQRSDPPA